MLSGIRLARQVQELAPVGPAAPTQRGVVMPWTSRGHLETVVWADLLDVESFPVTRAEAMTVPSIVKARHILVGLIAGLPLVALKAGARVEPQPPFLFRTSGATTPWHRMAWTLDDLLFFGWSVWAVERGADGTILDAVRVPPDWWALDDMGQLTIGGEPVDASEVVIFPGPSEGLLDHASRTIRAARNLETSWATRVRNPIPVMEIHQTTDDELEDDEIKGLLDAYATQRLAPNGALVFTPSNVELIPHGADAPDVLVEARNAIRLDVANMTGLPGEALDGSLSTASLTYTTQQGTRTELADALRMWTEPITARLSQDDVVPRGQYVRFDVTDIAQPIPTGTGSPAED